MHIDASVRQAPVRWTDEAFDFKRSSPLRKSYIIASLTRSGSQFLASELWKTGLLGAPCEYLFPAYDMRPMMRRLKATSLQDYIAKLLACRTSQNGVFGTNVHIQHFTAFLQSYPALLDVLAPLTFIHTTRRNKLAQAVSMAKAYQTSAWTSQMKASLSSAHYNRHLIETCLEDIDQQESQWEQWFTSNNVIPLRVVYEDFAADPTATVRSVIELLGVQGDEPEQVEVPPVERQSDGTNKAWIARFEAETSSASAGQPTDAIGTADEGAPAPETFTDDTGVSLSGAFKGLYDRHISNLPAASPSAAYVDAIRSRHLFKMIIEQNLALFENARVLEFPSIDGRWGLAALDAGAAYYVGVESFPRIAAKAATTFTEYGVNRNSYELINAEIFSALGSFEPGSFDLIMCVRFFERFDPYRVFQELHRLGPQFVILDTAVAPGRGPVLRFSRRILEIPEANPLRADATGSIITTPSEDLIEFMCDLFGYRYRRLEWQSLGITDWTGLHDYAQGRRLSCVLERNQ